MTHAEACLEGGSVMPGQAPEQSRGFTGCSLQPHAVDTAAEEQMAVALGLTIGCRALVPWNGLKREAA